METQGLPAVEAARPDTQHGGGAAASSAAPAGPLWSIGTREPPAPPPEWDGGRPARRPLGLYDVEPSLVICLEEGQGARPQPPPSPPRRPSPQPRASCFVFNLVAGRGGAEGRAGRRGERRTEPPGGEQEGAPGPAPAAPTGPDPGPGAAEPGPLPPPGPRRSGPPPSPIAAASRPSPPAAEGSGGRGGAGPGPGGSGRCWSTHCPERLTGGGRAGGGGGRAARPFGCPVPGCAWSFATAYKLRRHLHSHDKLRPFACAAPGCTKRFTTVYNLRAHGRAHEQEAAHKCEACGQRFPSAARLGAHQRRSHLEPDRPYRCEFPGCERTFITVSALFSHNRAHFREQEQFSCSFPGCSKQYDKACRLKIHMRSHTGERPFICDSEGCGWSFTSMSKLLRHKRKHEDDRRFTCPVEGCGKSFTRAEHLKGHSITHLGTKPFECPVEGCCAKFSARSSLYIHSKKHLQDVDSSKTRCPVSSCNKLFTSKHSMKSHMVKQHNFSPDLLTQLEATSSLTPSSELTSPGQNDLSNIDLVSLFSNVSGNNSGIATDMALVNSGIVTIDVASVGSTLAGNLSVNSNSLGQTVDPLILVASSDIPHSLDSSLLMGTTATVLQQSTSNLDDVQTVNAEALGSLASLSVKNSSQDLHGLTSSNNLTIDTTTLTPSSSLGGSNGPELLTPTKAERNLLPSSDVVGQQEGSKVVTQFVFSNPPGSYSAQKEMDLGTVTCSSFLESGGSARTDYRAIQLAKKRKQKGNGSSTAASNSGQRKGKGGKVSPTSFSSTSHGNRLCGNIVLPNGGLTIRDPATGAQYVQIQLLQGGHPGPRRSIESGSAPHQNCTGQHKDPVADPCLHSSACKRSREEVFCPR
uniref:C2H2-type domain-containing protein n=1 Tax=Chelonoidis abingdonii TaxID=106734 RepID=A0A8C0GC24_CHEAB